MSHELTTTPSTDLSDRAVALIRTAIPAAWGSLVALLLGWLSPHLPVDVVDALTGWLGGEAAIALVTTLAVVAWYWLWRRVEHLVPDWLVTLVLGNARTPVYAPKTADGAFVITSLTPADHVELGLLASALDEGDPSRVAIEKVLRTTA